ncbi:hypothetical protein JCM10213_006543 [Rhodosporidiobolus nylandii]
MLDRLPIELLSLVLRLATPLDYSPELYKERRETLRNCCLVSRRMRELAQPMLPEVFEATKEEVALLSAHDGKAECVRLLVMHASGVTAEMVARQIMACPRLTELRITRHDAKLELGVLSGLPSLRSLVLGSVRIHPTPLTPLRSLTELSLCGSYINRSTLDVLLSSFITPALSALGLAAISPSSSPGTVSQEYIPDLPVALLARLDVLSIDHYDLPDIEVLKRDDLVPVLLDYGLPQSGSPTEPPPPSSFSLRLYFDADAILDDLNPYFEFDIADGIQGELAALGDGFAGSTNLASSRVLILPNDLPFNQSSALGRALEAFSQACAHSGIEVVEEKQADWPRESLISPWFWRRARRIKQDQAKAEKEQ